MQPDGGSRRSSSARVRREQLSAPPTSSGEMKASKTKEFDGIALLVGHFSVPVLTRPHVISKPRCPAELHGNFKHAQRQSRDGRFLSLVGGYDQLVGNQIARLSSCGVVILSEFLSSYFVFNSSTVRNVLRGWIAHGDVAAVCLTEPLTSSAAACLFETCHQARSSSAIRIVSLSSIVSTVTLSFSRYQWICAFRKRFMFFSVNVPVRLKLARRCNNFDHVCSFSGKAHRQLGFCFQDRFLHRTHRVRYARFCCSRTCSLVPCQGQLDKQAASVGLNDGQGHRLSGRGLQCAVIRAESSSSLRLFLEPIAEHPRTQHKLSGQKVIHIPSHDERQMQLRKIQSDDKTQYRVRLHHIANKYVLKMGLTLGVIQTGSQNQRNPNAPKFEARSIEGTLSMEEKARGASWVLHKSVYKFPGSYSENGFLKPSPANDVSSFSATTKERERENSLWTRSFI